MAQPWRTVRVFISSTFRDMHAERDHLVRMVFPELKERCRQRHVQLIDVDLRWGVTQEQAEGGGALDICLDEIDTCRPYFIGLLGHRYGSVPPGHEHSITAQEIYHGVLHNYLPKQVIDLRPIVEGILEGRTLLKEQVNCLVRCYQWDQDKRKYLLQDNITPEDEEMLRSIFREYSIYQRDRSFFFFRSESLTTKLAGPNIQEFFEAGQKTRDGLTSLKQDIVKAGLSHYEYDDLEAFGRMVLDTLWARIDAEFPAGRVEERDWLEQEAEFHDLFMADRTRRFVGRDDLLSRMHSFVEGDSESKILVITGEPGCGKSALMARFAEQAIHKHPDWLVIPHFIGASPSSTSLRLTLRRLCTHLSRAIAADKEIPENYRALEQLFPELVRKASEKRTILLIMDALNQLERTDNAHSMRWLPVKLPENIRVVLSTLPGEALDALKARYIRPEFAEAKGLTGREIKELVTAYLKEIRKEFPTAKESKAFYEKIKDGNPLYIIVSLEELRVFPVYEELSHRIANLPDSVPALFDQVLERIEGDFNKPLVRDFMSFVACGRQGMTAEELQTLLREHAPVVGPENPPNKFPDMLFARLRRAFSAYLFERSGVIDFFHSQLKEAVGRRYLFEESGRDETHRVIAEYFEQRWREPYVRALDELAHQLTKAEDWQGLERVLCDLFFIEAKCAAGMTYDLVTDYNTALDSLPEAQEERQKELERERRIAQYTRDVITYAKGEIDHLDIIPSVRPWTDKEIEAESERIVNSPSRLDKIHAFSQFVNSEGDALLRFASHPGFTIQHAANSASLGPVAAAAESGISSGTDDVLLLIHPPHRPDYNPHPALLRTLQGHTERVTSVALTPDGRRAVSGSWDETLMAWDLETGRCLGTLEGHTDAVNSVAMTPDGRRAVSGGRDRTVKVWDLVTSRCLRTLEGHMDVVNSVALTSDGRRAVSGSDDKTLRMWDLETGRCLRTLEGHTERVKSVALTPDGRRAVSGSDDETLRMWDLEIGQCIGTHEVYYAVWSVALTPDGRRAVSGSDDYTLAVWDLQIGQCLRILKGSWILNIAITPDGRMAVSGSENDTLSQWDLEAGRCLRTLPRRTNFCISTLQGHKNKVTSIAISADGRKAVSGSDDYTLAVWDLETGRCLSNLLWHTDSVRSVALTPDSRKAVSGSDDYTLAVWDLKTGRYPRGVWDPENPWRGQYPRTLQGHMDSVFSLAVTADGSRAVSGSMDNTLRVWDLESGQCLSTLRGHTTGVTSVAIAPDGRRAVSGSLGDTLKVWDLETGRCLRTLRGNTTGGVASVAITPDGRRAVSGGGWGKTLKVWDLKTGRCLRTLLGHTWGVTSVAITPDGRRAVSGSGDTTLKLWDMETGQCLSTFHGHNSSITSVAITPDGRRTASASWGKTLRLWDLETGSCLAICHLREIVMDVALNAKGLVVCGTQAGEILFYNCRNLDMQPTVATPVLMWLPGLASSLETKCTRRSPVTTPILRWLPRNRQDLQRKLIPWHTLVRGSWDDAVKAVCPWCGGRFPVADEILDVIRAINRNAHLSPDQSPCLDLPAGAWDEPRLLSECPLCHKPLKFNPFIVDNRGQY